MNISVFCMQGKDGMVLPIVDYLRQFYDVNMFYGGDQQEFWEVLNRSDLVWFEGLEQWVIEATQGEKSSGKYLFRLFGDEVFSVVHDGRVFFDLINWNRVDATIFPSVSSLKHINRLKHIEANRRMRDMKAQGREVYINPFLMPPVLDFDKTYEINNFVDHNFFAYNPDKERKSIGYLVDINDRSNIYFVVYFFRQLLKYDPEFVLHVNVSDYDYRYLVSFEYFLQDIPQDKLKFYTLSNEDTAKWIGKMDYLLSTCPFESFSYTLAAGMATGSIPLLHDFEGAKEIYPEEHVFNDPHDAVALIEKIETEGIDDYRKKCRDWAVNNFNRDIILSEVKKVVDRLLWTDKAANLYGKVTQEKMGKKLKAEHVDFEDIFKYGIKTGTFKSKNANRKGKK